MAYWSEQQLSTRTASFNNVEFEILLTVLESSSGSGNWKYTTEVIVFIGFS